MMCLMLLQVLSFVRKVVRKSRLVQHMANQTDDTGKGSFCGGAHEIADGTQTCSNMTESESVWPDVPILSARLT